MSSAEVQLRGVGDARLAVHATSNQPVWLWSPDGTRILWANPVGARLFGARNAAALFAKTFGPADQHRRQIAQLANRLPADAAVRLERLRGFGASLGGLMTCACTRLEFADGGAGVLVVAVEPTGRFMPLNERLQNLVEGLDTPIAAFARDGVFIGASDAARTLLGFRNLTEGGLDHARDNALKDGRVETPIGFGHMVLQRVGSGADVGLVALIAPGALHAAPTEEEAEADHAEPADDAPHVAAVELADPAAEAALADVVEVDPALAPDAFTEHAAEVDHAINDDMPAEQPAAAENESTDDADDSESSTRFEAAIAETIAQAGASSHLDAPHEPSLYVEAVADEPAHQPVADDLPAPEPRTAPLRFVWQIDAEQRFSLNSDEFTQLIGPHAAASGRTWNEIADEFGLDPDGRIVTAMATRNTFGGIALLWPADGGRLPVELSGLPLFDREHRFAGYRGFGVCRDLEAMNRLAETRRHEVVSDPPPRSLPADIAQAGPVGDRIDEPLALPEPIPPTEPDTAVEPPKNVVQFRPGDLKSGDLKSPVLSPGENSAFNELARQLSQRLEAETGLTTDQRDPQPVEVEAEVAAEPKMMASPSTQPANTQPEWLVTPPAPARGEMLRDKTLLDLLPVGVLIYRLDRLLFANPAFLAAVNYPSLHALEEAGGLDALYVEPDVSATSSASDGGTAVTITATEKSADTAAMPPAEARLFTIAWDNEPAHALIFSASRAEPAAAVAPVAVAAPEIVEEKPLPEGAAIDAEELAAILDTTAEGVIMFDAEGNINSCNRSAEALFGYDGAQLTQRNVTDLFAQESRRVVRDYLDSIKEANVASLLDHGREALGQVRAGGLVPLSIMMGRTRAGGPNFFAMFRDLTQAKKTESELLHARRQADRAATAKADVLARISHEVRTPLNAIIGFAEVMIDERFGPLGNERYGEYMKDVRASGERVLAIVNDLLDLSRIETGKLDLSFTTQNLNEMVEQCVAVMQPQANRGRIIIRTSLAHLLPTVVADARALRQITLNLIGNSIHLANAGGQVIVSTALSDFGEVMLRVRDTGHGLNDHELAAAMEPFGSQAPGDQAAESSGVSLSLTKALVEANRARFQIKTAPSSGTLIEVVFSNAVVKA